MFTSKKTQLFDNKSKTTSVESNNGFVQAATRKTTPTTTTANGAKVYKTSNNVFVDQFANITSYRKPRTFAEIEKDQELLWGSNKTLTVAFSLYLRMISRITDVFGTKTQSAQKGAGLKHEGIMRMIWLHIKSPATFWKNVSLMTVVGSWKDIFVMLQYDLIYNGWESRKLDWNKFGKLILAGLNDENQNNLLKKYLPQIKSNSNCKTVESQADNMIAKWICSLLYGNKENSGTTYKMYRKLKTSGTAHEWQKLISQGKHDLVDFKSIHGRALNQLVKSKYLYNQNLTDKYEAWITKPTTEAKYTGFVYELFKSLPERLSSMSIGEQETINKQFNTLVKSGGPKTKTSLIVVRDTSGSMGSHVQGTGMSCYNVAKAMALYFSEFLTGHFKNNWIEFNSRAQMHTWNGNTPLEKWYNDRTQYNGSTNFQSVVDLFCQLRQQGVNENEFPTGILCISDSEFNSSSLSKTNVETAKQKLRNAGFSDEYCQNFVIVLWNLQSSRQTAIFETPADTTNVFYLSGFDGSVVSFIENGVKNSTELFEEAMNQEVLGLVKV